METSKLHPRPRRGRRRPMHDQRFSSYLGFGHQCTVCIAIFLGIYALVILCLAPLLHTETSSTGHGEAFKKHGEALKPALDPLKEKLKHVPHAPAQQLAEGVAGAVKKQIETFRKKEGVTDAEIMKKAAEEIAHLRKRREENKTTEDNVPKTQIQPPPDKRSGFVVLGMHRSGTSMLSGLLVTGAGYKTGGPLIGSAADNEKGFFERVDVVLQNDAFMKPQNIWWSANVVNYDPDRALADKESGKVDFEKGESALQFLNDPANAPWLQKDPRMCITLKTWLKLLNNEPAVVFTYRHPLEVALSLKKRENNFTLEHGLRLWIVYNMRAIQNSAGLCTVYSSNEVILSEPLIEVQRIADELTSKCKVPETSQKITQEDVDKFVDPALQHNKKKREEEDASLEIVTEHDGCVVRDYETDMKKDSEAYKREHSLYLKAMKIYCDFQSGKAYEPDYEWPELQ